MAAPKRQHKLSQDILTIVGMVEPPLPAFARGSVTMPPPDVIFNIAGIETEFPATQFGGATELINVSNPLLETMTALTAEVRELRGAVETAVKGLAAVTRRLDELRATEAPEANVVRDEDARTTIKSYFEAHHGETLYPSDVAAALHLPYRQVTKLLDELERDGQIART